MNENPQEQELTPLDNDVLCGRGGYINTHPGNERFRQLVLMRKRVYLTARFKREKRIITDNIISIIQNLNPPGRFLAKDESEKWYEIGEEKARDKVSQALRENAPKLRKQLQQEDAMMQQYDRPNANNNDHDQNAKLHHEQQLNHREQEEFVYVPRSFLETVKMTFDNFDPSYLCLPNWKTTNPGTSHDITTYDHQTSPSSLKFQGNYEPRSDEVCMDERYETIPNKKNQHGSNYNESRPSDMFYEESNYMSNYRSGSDDILQEGSEYHYSPFGKRYRDEHYYADYYQHNVKRTAGNEDIVERHQKTTPQLFTNSPGSAFERPNYSSNRHLQSESDIRDFFSTSYKESILGPGHKKYDSTIALADALADSIENEESTDALMTDCDINHIDNSNEPRTPPPKDASLDEMRSQRGCHNFVLDVVNRPVAYKTTNTTATRNTNDLDILSICSMGSGPVSTGVSLCNVFDCSPLSSFESATKLPAKNIKYISVNNNAGTIDHPLYDRQSSTSTIGSFNTLDDPLLSMRSSEIRRPELSKQDINVSGLSISTFGDSMVSLSNIFSGITSFDRSYRTSE